MYFVVYILHVWCGAFVVGVFNLTIRFYQHLFWLMCVNFILLCRVAAVNKRQKLTRDMLSSYSSLLFLE